MATTSADVGIREVEIVDTAAAGNTFMEGLLAEWIKQRPLRECFDAGRDLAAEARQYIWGIAADWCTALSQKHGLTDGMGQNSWTLRSYAGICGPGGSST
jgi:pfkB family carbohydrate kinase